VVESSEDAIITKTLEGVITSWNRGAERIYGYRADEVIGQPISLLAPPDRADEIRRILEKIGRGEPVEHFDSVRVAKDGHRLKVSITVSPIHDATGKLIGASTIARDMSSVERARQALAETEYRAQALFDAAVQAIFIVDARGKIVMANPATQKMFGFAADELRGRSIEVLVPWRLKGKHESYRNRTRRPAPWA
jgi:PAS domain S-box-containing protein